MIYAWVLEIDIQTFKPIALGFEVGTWYLLVSFLHWSFEARIRRVE